MKKSSKRGALAEFLGEGPHPDVAKKYGFLFSDPGFLRGDLLRHDGIEKRNPYFVL